MENKTPQFNTNEQFLEKQKLWDAKKAEVESWADGLGRGIEANIKDTVIALNLLGYPTLESCEGHKQEDSDHDCYPWVTFEVRKLPQFKDGDYELTSEVLEKEKELMDKLQSLIEEHNALTVNNVVRYGVRDPNNLKPVVVPEEYLSITDPRSSQAKELDTKAKDVFLSLAREEMNHLTEFFKKKYFESK